MNIYITKEAIQVLKDARTILEKPNGWGRGDYAMDNKGRWTNVTNPKACRFCSLGAVAKAGGVDYLENNDHAEAAQEILEPFMTLHDDESIADRNDMSTTKHQHVLMAFDLAILSAEDELKKAQRKK